MVKTMNYTLLLVASALILNACESKEKPNSTSDTNIVATPNQVKPEESKTASSMPLTTLKFTESSFDFGKIKEGVKVDHVFKFTNTGTNPLVLQDARASCGCTIPEYTKDTIAPGQEGKIKVIYDSSNRHGQIDKTVTVTANTEPSTTDIKISAFVLDKEEKKDGPYNK